MPFNIAGEWVPDKKEAPPKLPIKIVKEKRRGDFITKIINIGTHCDNLKKVNSFLKKKLACGGAVKNQDIELQGDHTEFLQQHLKTIINEQNQKSN